MHRVLLVSALLVPVAAGCGDNLTSSSADASSPDAPPPDASPNAPQLTAIVRLDDCSASVVRFSSSQPTDAALVLTNGHCIGGTRFLGAGEAVAHRPDHRVIELLAPSVLAPAPAPNVPPSVGVIGSVTSTELVYATMTGTDVAIYQLPDTYAQLESQYGVKALTLSEQQAAVATPIQVVSGFWDAIYTCSIDGFVYELKESVWTWDDSLRYHQPGCETIGGTSGSPVIDADTQEVVGINNTGNDSGQQCTLDNPCEVDSSGNITVTQGAAYGQEIDGLYTCFTNGQLDLARTDCTLTKPAA